MAADEPCFLPFFLKKAFFMSFAGEKKVCIDENDFHFWPLIELYKSRTSANWPARGGKNDYVDEFVANVRVSAFVIY